MFPNDLTARFVNALKDETQSLKTITSDHSSIHSGEGFSISGIFSSVANSSTVNYAFKTPSADNKKIIHLKYRELSATANKVRVDFYEAPTNDPTLGTDVIAYNHNRVGTPKDTTMQAIKSGMTIDTTGANLLETTQFISGNARSLDIEWDLKPDTWYIRTFTNATGSPADISFFEFWYEED